MRFAAVVAACAGLLVTGCEDYRAQHLHNCKTIMNVSIELWYSKEYKGTKPPVSARPALEAAADELCECRIRSVEALETVPESDKQAYYHEGTGSQDISEQSYPLIKSAFDACDRAFETATAAAKGRTADE